MTKTKKQPFINKLFKGLHKITGVAVYFSNLWGLLFRVDIINKGEKAFIEKPLKVIKHVLKQKLFFTRLFQNFSLEELLPQKVHFQTLLTW